METFMKTGESSAPVCKDCIEVTEVDGNGLKIYRHKINIGDIIKEKTSIELGADDAMKDIYIVVNTGSLPDLTFFPEDATNKIQCKRCQYIAKRALKYLERDQRINLGDITGICDHCRNKLKPQDIRILCDNMVNKYFTEKVEKEKKKVKQNIGPTFPSVSQTTLERSELNKMLHKRFEGAPQGHFQLKKRVRKRFISEEFTTPFPKIPKLDSEIPKNKYSFPSDLKEEPTITTFSEILMTAREEDRILTEEISKGKKEFERKTDDVSSDEVMLKKYKAWGKEGYHKLMDKSTTVSDSDTRKEYQRMRNILKMKGYEGSFDKEIFKEYDALLQKSYKKFRDEGTKTKKAKDYRSKSSDAYQQTKADKDTDSGSIRSDNIDWRKNKHKFVPKKDTIKKKEMKQGPAPSEHIMIKSTPFAQIVKRSENQKIKSKKSITGRFTQSQTTSTYKKRVQEKGIQSEDSRDLERQSEDWKDLGKEGAMSEGELKNKYSISLLTDKGMERKFSEEYDTLSDKIGKSFDAKKIRGKEEIEGKLDRESILPRIQDPKLYRDDKMGKTGVEESKSDIYEKSKQELQSKSFDQIDVQKDKSKDDKRVTIIEKTSITETSDGQSLSRKDTEKQGTPSDDMSKHMRDKSKDDKKVTVLEKTSIIETSDAQNLSRKDTEKQGTPSDDISKHEDKAKQMQEKEIKSKEPDHDDKKLKLDKEVVEKTKKLPPPPPKPKVKRISDLKKQKSKDGFDKDKSDTKKKAKEITLPDVKGRKRQKTDDITIYDSKLKLEKHSSEEGLVEAEKKKKVEKERTNSIILGMGLRQISEPDLITKAMKGREKLRDQVRPTVEEKGPGKPKRLKKYRPKTPKSKPSIDEPHEEEEIDVMETDATAKEIPPPKSLLQSHLKGIELSKKAGQRDADALARAEKELKISQIRIQAEKDTLQYAISSAKHSTKLEELPQIPNKYALFQITTSAPVYKEPEERKLVDSDIELDKESELQKPRKGTPREMIKQSSIIDFSPSMHTKVEDGPKRKPLFYNTDHTKFPSIEMPKKSLTSVEVEKRDLEKLMSLDDENRNVLRFTLSDRTYIDKGWTMLPTEKVLRKMNVYRMRPSHPEFDWFKRNYSKGYMQYDTGETLAVFESDCRGRCYYRNGRLALSYYDAEETNAGKRYVVYSSGNPDKSGRPRPVTVLAMFDHAGNGIVFDHDGNTRLKYNQTEGEVLDPTLGSSKWKWHTLNDPPDLQKVMIDTHEFYKDPTILEIGMNDVNHRLPRHTDEKMIAIEFDNFVKEKSKKLSVQFTPFQIKMKALQINEEFSLKILDQKTIYLLFQDGKTHITFNLGMILDNKEIVDTETMELGEVSNSLERLPARTTSLESLQIMLKSSQRKKQCRVAKENRINPPVSRTVESSDQMVAALSRPLRTIGNVHACTPCPVINPTEYLNC